LKEERRCTEVSVRLHYLRKPKICGKNTKGHEFMEWTKSEISQWDQKGGGAGVKCGAGGKKGGRRRNCPARATAVSLSGDKRQWSVDGGEKKPGLEKGFAEQKNGGEESSCFGVR